MSENTEKKSGKKTVVTVIVVLALIAATVAAVLIIRKPKKNNGGWGSWGGGWGGGNTVTSVKTVLAEPVVLKDFVITNGDVETQSWVDVFPSIGGALVQVNVSLGSTVQKGDIIAYVDPSEPGMYYAKSPVKAPISGSVLTSPAKTGTRVSTGTMLTKIGDIDNLQITAKVPERYVSELKIGLKADIILEAYPEEAFAAKVVRISPVLDPATRTKEIILNFDSKDSRINAGMFAKVKLYTTEYTDKFAILQDSVVNNGDRHYLFVVNDDTTVTKREVTLGKNVDGYYQVTSGIEFGETVVTEGMLTLYDGAFVKDITNGVPEEPAFDSDGEGFGNSGFGKNAPAFGDKK